MGAPVGNQNGRKAKLWADAIKRALAKLGPEGERTVEAGLSRLADKLIAAAEAGDPWALKEIGDRLDGKPAQALQVDGDGEGGAIKHALEVRFVE